MLTLALFEARAAAGEIVHGRIERPDDSTRVAVELVRVEHSPVGAFSYRVAGAEPDSDGSFALAVPDDAPPDVVGSECSLQYAIRAVARRDEVRQPVSIAAEQTVARPTLPEQLELSERAALSERLVASFSGRRMHVELSDADLRGGGRIEGRIHLDRAPASGRLLATVRCIESWRVSPRPGRLVLMSRANAIPLWRQRVCFEHGLELESLDDAHWRAFSFDASRRAAARGRGALDRLALRGRGAALRPDRPRRPRPASHRSPRESTCSRAPARIARRSARGRAAHRASALVAVEVAARSPSRAPARGTRPTRRASRR